MDSFRKKFIETNTYNIVVGYSSDKRYREKNTNSI